MSASLVEVEQVSKAYGGVQALSEVSLTIRAGETHALVGENGAGKSTLIKILSGAVSPDSGRVLVHGVPLAPGDVTGAEAAGIATIHQEFTAFPFLSAQDNIFVGHEPRHSGGWMLDRPRMRRETAALLERLGVDIAVDRPVGELPPSARQMVAMARAMSRQSRVLILDEPTALLSTRETSALFGVLRRLQEEGVGLLYVSHRLEEVFALADRVTVLRDGRWVDTSATKELDRDGLIRRMVGRDVNALTGSESASRMLGERVLEVRELSRTDVFQDISFSVRAGEIVGLAGLVGAGRSEIAQTIFGIDRPTSGSVTVAGKRLKPGSVREAVRSGVALVPEDRQHLGLVLPLPVGDNLVLSILRSLSVFGFRSSRRESALITRLLRDLAVRAAGARVPAHTLSGGNQQKLVLGKWLATTPRLLLLDEPTRGVDVGAKAEIYPLIRRLAAQGMATLLISSELPELLALSDRILVMRQGRLAGEVSGADASEEKVLSLALGEVPAAAVGRRQP